jgi:nucleotide-binding universal stress UspA family protein
MKTILVPTDGSAAAEKALDLALDLAQKHDADLKLLHVLLRDKEPDELLRLPELSEAEGDMVGELHACEHCPEAQRTVEELMGARNVPKRPAPESLLRQIGAHVLKRATAHAEERGVSAEMLDLADGAAAPAIKSAAEATNADTIVMGTRGLRQIEAVTFGSVSQEVCRTVQCTCVAVH